MLSLNDVANRRGNIMLLLDGLKKQVLDLVRKYGEDSLAYLTLEDGKKYFFSKNNEGFIAYVIVGKIAVCLGNPICAKENFRNIINEFKEFCKENKLKICFSSASCQLVKILEDDNYYISKYGEEAVLDLSIYKTVGSSTSKLRQKLRRAEKCGINTIEYQPQKYRNFNLEQKIAKVSEEWYEDKNLRLGFTLGEINLDNPLDRRYFISMDENNQVQAVLVFSPFCHGEGYFLDVMRRKKRNGIPGAMEKSIIDSAVIMREEGIRWLSLGIAPLAGIDKQNEMNSLEKCFNFTYNYMNHSYGFKTLYDYKRKFAPSQWEIRYVVHEPGLSCFKVCYALAKARNTDNFWIQFTLGVWQTGKTVGKQLFSRYVNNISAKVNYER